jgi:molecular chaperone DnaK
MTKEAELHAEEDRKRKESVETKNQLDSTIYQLEKTLKESGNKLPADKKAPIEAGIADAKKALESDDTAQMKAAMEKLTALGGELYAEAQKAAQSAPGGETATPEGETAQAGENQPKKTEKKADVVDADFEVVDDDKKK